MSSNWDDYRIFLAIARAGSLTAAARELGVSQPTVSRRLSAFETVLSTRLFDRTRSGYTVTDAGRGLLESLGDVEQTFSNAAHGIQEGETGLSGTIRFTCTEIFLNGYLGPFVWQFLNEHPGLGINLSTSRSPLNLNRGESEVALRFTASPPEQLAGRRLTRVAYGIYASTGYPEDRLSKERAVWDWIGVNDEHYNRQLFDSVAPGCRFKHQVDSIDAIQAMARKGLGVCLLPCYLADRDAHLRRVERQVHLFDWADLWLLYHPGFRRSRRVRLFADYLAEQIENDTALFEGLQPN